MNRLNKLLLSLIVLSVSISLSISASYGGDKLHAGSEGLFVLPLVTDPTSTTVSCAPSTVIVGQAMTCNATVTDTSLITPTGSVSFTVTGGTGTVGSCTLAGTTAGNASCSVTYTPACASSSQVITGSYAGDAAHSSSSGFTSVQVSGQQCGACVPSSTSVGNVCFTTDAGQLTNLMAVSQSSLPPNPDPTFMTTTFNFGFFSFDITGITPFGSTVTVTETYPTIPSNAVYWKYDSVANQWIDVTSLVTFSGNVLTLTLMDGGIGDSDGVQNGQISDPGGLGHRDIPPVAAFTFSPATPTVGQMVNYYASSSYDPDGTINNYMWNFGDSTTGTGVAPTHVYVAPSTYTVTLTVTDNAGLTGQSSAQIMVSQGVPGAHVSFFQWSVRPQWKKFSIVQQGKISNGADPIQAFAVNDGNQTVWSYVKFTVTGDSGVNEVLYTQTVQLTPGQQINGNQDPRFTANFVPTTPGTYFIQATVYYSTSSTQPPVGDPSFITTPPNNAASNSFLVRP